MSGRRSAVISFYTPDSIEVPAWVHSELGNKIQDSSYFMSIGSYLLNLKLQCLPGRSS